MLIDGKKINIPFKRDIIFPRVDEDIVFTAMAISSEEEFEKICKEPEAPKEMDKNGNFIRFKLEDKKYVEARRKYFSNRLNFQIIKSLVNVQWESVDLADPDTWDNWKKECLDSGLSDIEVARVIGDVMDTHSPTQKMVDEMRERFLSGSPKEPENPSHSQSTDQENT